MMNTITKCLEVAAVVTAAVLVGLTSPAFSADRQGPSVSVRIDDLDLSHAKGRETFELRLKAAARQVCGSPNARRIEETVARRECHAQAIAQARAQLENAQQVASR